MTRLRHTPRAKADAIQFPRSDVSAYVLMFSILIALMLFVPK